MAVQPRSSSAVMLLRDAAGGGLEVFMVRRVIQSDFMPDVYVFPGGSVQADDLAVEGEPGICRTVSADGVADPEGRTALGRGVRAAAIRELFEEAGVLLVYQGDEILAVNEGNRERFAAYRQAFNTRQGSLVKLAQTEGLTLATDRLRYFTHWITPEGLPKRFDTHFFITTAPAEQHALYDNLETSEGLWISPAEALERAQRDAFPIVFATIHQLYALAAFQSVEEALQISANTPVKTHAPVLVERAGQMHVHLPGDEEGLWAVPEYMTRVRH